MKKNKEQCKMGYDQLQWHQYSMIDTFYEVEISKNRKNRYLLCYMTNTQYAIPKDLYI